MSGGSPSTLKRFPTVSETKRHTLTLWTDSPSLALKADLAGVDRIGPDFELLGKCERQGPGYRISRHSRDCLPAVRRSVRRGQLFARTDPVHRGTRAEVDHLLDQRVDVLMVPMIRSADDVHVFNSCVGDRAKVVLLLEHVDALQALDEILDVSGTDEIHIGLNDLALSIGEPERFSLLCSPLLEQAAGRVHEAGLPLGIAGIGRFDDASLPIDPDLIYAELARLGATSALLARSFGREGGVHLARDLVLARERLRRWCASSDDELMRAHIELCKRVRRAP